jgi:hypothetical protein
MSKINHEEMQNGSEYLVLYSFYDKKSETFDTPFCCQTDLFAQRHYHMVTTKPGSLLCDFKEDFDLYRIGYFNTNDSSLIEHSTLLITGKKEIK